MHFMHPNYRQITIICKMSTLVEDSVKLSLVSKNTQSIELVVVDYVHMSEFLNSAPVPQPNCKPLKNLLGA